MWVVAPDKFKGTLTAREATDAIVSAMEPYVPNIKGLPLGDGGDGTARLIAEAEGLKEIVIHNVPDAYGRKFDVPCYVEGGRGVVEVADVVGLADAKRRGEPLDVMKASSAGVGVVIKELMDRGIKEITICLGGSATADGGAGALSELRKKQDSKIAFWLNFLCDVTISLLPEHEGDMSALDFVEQKGCSSRDFEALRGRLERWAKECGKSPYEPMTGAAGGIGYGLSMLPGEHRMVEGAEYMIDLMGVMEQEGLEGVITGEGRLDRQSWAGKVVGALVRRTAERGLPLVVIAGSVSEDAMEGVGENVIVIDCSAGEREKVPGTKEEAERRLRDGARRAGEVIASAKRTELNDHNRNDI